MSAYDDMINLPRGSDALLVHKAFAQKIKDDIAALTGGGLTNQLVFGAREITSAVDIAMTSSDAVLQSVSMSTTGKAVTLPNATGVVEGMLWTIYNAGSNSFALKAFGGSTLIANVAPGAYINVTLANDGTSAGVWIISRVNLETFTVACSDEVTPLTAGTGKLTFRMPFAMNLTEIRGSLNVAQASGSIFTVDVNEAGATALTTKLTIDNTEKTSTTAATPAVIGGAGPALADDAEMTVDIDQIGDGTAKGLKLTFIGYRV